MKKMGQRIKHVRESHGIDQDAFGVAIGAARNTIYRWEKGLAYPPADVLFIVHEKYGINIHWLVTGEGSMKGEEIPRDRQDAPALDTEVLQRVIVSIEQGIAKKDVVVEAERKAKIITFIYELAVKTGQTADEEMVAKVLSLIS